MTPGIGFTAGNGGDWLWELPLDLPAITSLPVLSTPSALMYPCWKKLAYTGALRDEFRRNTKALAEPVPVRAV